MTPTRLVSALLFATLASHVVAEDGYQIVMQGSTEPGQPTELLVFVGEQVAYEPLDISCDGECWVFDDWHKARYRVAEPIHGVAQGEELEFDVAEHSVTVPFGDSRHSLVFVQRHETGLALVKYQQLPVHPTADGSFAACGIPWGEPADHGQPDSRAPALRDVGFSPRLVVDDARRLSAHGRATAHDPRWHEIIGDEVVCHRGIPVAELVPEMIRRHDMLRAALPGLAGAGR